MTLDTEQLEHLISRRLDGALTAEEARALEAALAADPRARELLAECQRIDDLARAALRRVTATPASRPPVAARRWSAARYVLPTALAAAAVLALFAIPWFHPPAVVAPGQDAGRKPPLNLVQREPDPLRETGPMPPFTGGDQGGAAFVDYIENPAVLPRNLHRRQSRDLIGLVADDGTILVVERQRQRSLVKPVGLDF